MILSKKGRQWMPLEHNGGHITIAMAKDETRSDSVKIRITPTLKEALQELADADGRSLAGYIERVLTNHVLEHERRDTKRR
jgi:hypothetical protein